MKRKKAGALCICRDRKVGTNDRESEDRGYGESSWHG